MQPLCNALKNNAYQDLKLHMWLIKMIIFKRVHDVNWINVSLSFGAFVVFLKTSILAFPFVVIKPWELIKFCQTLFKSLLSVHCYAFSHLIKSTYKMSWLVKFTERIGSPAAKVMRALEMAMIRKSAVVLNWAKWSFSGTELNAKSVLFLLYWCINFKKKYFPRTLGLFLTI